MSNWISSPSESARPPGLALGSARLLWILLAVIYFAVFVAACPVSIANYQELCSGDDCTAFQLAAQELAVLEELGVSHDFYASFLPTSELLLLTWAGLGVVIYLRRSDDWIGLLASMALIAVGINGISDNVSILSEQTPALAPLYNTLSAIGSGLIILMIFLFPDGRFVPDWGRYLAFPLALLAFADPLLEQLVPSMESSPGTVAQLAALLIGLIAALFNPLRQRIQTVVNRRFFRADYDAAQTLSAFGESVRDEVDLTEMQSSLLNTGQETMQPTLVSLWLRGNAGDPAIGQ